MEKHLLRLYVAGRNHLSRKAIDNLQRICDEDLEGRFTMEVIDILEQPALAEDQRILATPVVIKELPPPLRRVVGDLSNRAQVIFGLDLATLEEMPENDG